MNINGKEELPGFEQYEKIELLYKIQEEDIESENPEFIREKLEKKIKIEVENETE